MGEHAAAAFTVFARQERDRREVDGRETERNKRVETGAERLRPSNSEGRSQSASRRNIPPGAAPLRPLLIQTPAAAPLPRLSNCRGSVTAGSKFLGLRVGPRTVAQTGGTQDLYWFSPPESNALRPVCAAALSALICNRGYK
jgi:hypothetical protein